MPTTLYPQTQFQVTEQLVDTKALLDEENFYHQKQGNPAQLTKTLTYIMGRMNRKYPISLMTLGGNGYGIENSAVELDDIQFTYPVMTKLNQASVVYSSEYTSTDKPGYGHGTFYVTFKNNWIKRYYIIQSQSGYQAYVHSDGEPVIGGYRYECTLAQGNYDDYIPYTELEPEIKWIDMFTAVAESQSRSTESKMVMPGMFKNQMGFMRAGIQWAGNVANKVMKLEIETDKGKTNVWMDYAMWQFEERWMEECEHYYWYSRYNRLADGTIPLKDALTAKTIPTGSGILEQITNKSTYSELTYNSLSNKIGDAFFGQSDTEGMAVTLMTGTGGRREFHRAMMNAGATFIAAGGVSDKFITGSGSALKFGGFFDGMYTVDGYSVNIKYNSVFDLGKVAQASPLHPVSGLPLESYRMVFLDVSDNDGSPNVKHVAQKGRSFIQGVLRGLTPMPRSLAILGGNKSGDDHTLDLGTVQDQSEYTRMKSGGIQIMRANRCFDLQCVAGL
jgi:hypothetical protein